MCSVLTQLRMHLGELILAHHNCTSLPEDALKMALWQCVEATNGTCDRPIRHLAMEALSSSIGLQPEEALWCV